MGEWHTFMIHHSWLYYLGSKLYEDGTRVSTFTAGGGTIIAARRCNPENLLLLLVPLCRPIGKSSLTGWLWYWLRRSCTIDFLSFFFRVCARRVTRCSCRFSRRCNPTRWPYRLIRRSSHGSQRLSGKFRSGDSGRGWRDKMKAMYHIFIRRPRFRAFFPEASSISTALHVPEPGLPALC